jgi:hypothetical protein
MKPPALLLLILVCGCASKEEAGPPYSSEIVMSKPVVAPAQPFPYPPISAEETRGNEKVERERDAWDRAFDPDAYYEREVYRENRKKKSD